MYLNLEKMQQIKNNDHETLKLWAYFSLKILNDKHSYTSYMNRLQDIERFNYQFEDEEHINLELLEDAINDNIQYIYVSGSMDNFGKIIKISNNICSQLGYLKEELLETNINRIMPDLYHNSHKDALLNTITSYKSSILEGGEKVTNPYKAKKLRAFYMNISRFLIPTTQKVCFVPSKNEDQQMFVAKILSNEDKIDNSKCYLLTDKELTIQNLTANFYNIFELNFEVIKLGRTKIVELITEMLNDENSFDDSFDYTDDEEGIKHRLINQFLTPKKITWNLLENKLISSNGPKKFEYENDNGSKLNY